MMTTQLNNLRIDKISVEQTYPLRSLVLRPGLPLSACEFAGDREKLSFHLGLWHQEQLLGIASFMPEEHPLIISLKQYRLRGMATHPQYQGQGLGKKLIQQSLVYLRDQKTTHLWCHAREKAVDFYLSIGFGILTPEFFEIPSVGPHQTLFYELG
jgi:predicted GNAT family N-acyltransferase